MRNGPFVTPSRWLATPIRGFRIRGTMSPVTSPSENKIKPSTISKFSTELQVKAPTPSQADMTRTRTSQGVSVGSGGTPRPGVLDNAGYGAEVSDVLATPTGQDIPVPPRPQ